MDSQTINQAFGTFFFFMFFQVVCHQFRRTSFKLAFGRKSRYTGLSKTAPDIAQVYTTNRAFLQSGMTFMAYDVSSLALEDRLGIRNSPADRTFQHIFEIAGRDDFLLLRWNPTIVRCILPFPTRLYLVEFEILPTI